MEYTLDEVPRNKFNSSNNNNNNNKNYYNKYDKYNNKTKPKGKCKLCLKEHDNKECYEKFKFHTYEEAKEKTCTTNYFERCESFPKR